MCISVAPFPTVSAVVVAEWLDNMDTVGKPKITKTKKKDKDYTRVTFTPDYARFGLDGLDTDHEALMCKRVYDMAGTTPKDVRVFLNGK